MHTDRVKLTVSRYVRPPDTIRVKCREPDKIDTEDLLSSDIDRRARKMRARTATRTDIYSRSDSQDSSDSESSGERNRKKLLLSGLFLGGV